MMTTQPVLPASPEGESRAHALRTAAAILGLGALACAALLLPRLAEPTSTAVPHHHHMAGAGHASEAGAGARPKTEVEVVSCNALANVPGHAVTTARVHYPPNAYTPAHRHPGAVTAFVISGTLRSQLNGGPVTTFTAGGTWFEPPGTLHNFIENASPTEPATLLAFYVAEENCGPLVIPER